MANSLGTNPIVIDDDTAAVSVGKKKVRALWFSATAAGTVTVLDGAGGNKVWYCQVDGSTEFSKGISFGEGIWITPYITATSGLTGTGATLYIYLA